MTLARFTGSTMEEDARFPVSTSNLSPQRANRRLPHRIAGQTPVEGIFICAWLLARQEGLVTCKKTHQEEKAATGDVGDTLFIRCRPGTAAARPARGRPRRARRRGSHSPCAASARTLSAAAGLNKESCTIEASLLLLLLPLPR